MPADHPEPMILKHPGELDQRLQAACVDLGDPAAQVLLRGVRIRELVEAVELLGQRVRADSLKRLGEQLVEQIALTLGQVRGSLKPHVPRVRQQLAVVGDLCAADLVNGLGEMRLDVVPVEGDLRFGRCVSVPFKNGSDMSWQTSWTCSGSPPCISKKHEN